MIYENTLCSFSYTRQERGSEAEGAILWPLKKGEDTTGPWGPYLHNLMHYFVPYNWKGGNTDLSILYFLWSVKGYMYGIRSLQMFCLLWGIYHFLRLLSCHMKHRFLIFPVIWYCIIHLSWGSAISGGTSLSSWWNTPSSKVGCNHHLLYHLWVRPELSCKWFPIVLLVPSLCAFPSRLDRLILKPPTQQFLPFSSTYLIMHHKRK